MKTVTNKPHSTPVTNQQNSGKLTTTNTRISFEIYPQKIGQTKPFIAPEIDKICEKLKQWKPPMKL